MNKHANRFFLVLRSPVAQHQTVPVRLKHQLCHALLTVRTLGARNSLQQDHGLISCVFALLLALRGRG